MTAWLSMFNIQASIFSETDKRKPTWYWTATHAMNTFLAYIDVYVNFIVNPLSCPSRNSQKIS